jgi:hypothetical protein
MPFWSLSSDENFRNSTNLTGEIFDFSSRNLMKSSKVVSASGGSSHHQPVSPVSKGLSDRSPSRSEAAQDSRTAHRQRSKRARTPVTIYSSIQNDNSEESVSFNSCLCSITDLGVGISTLESTLKSILDLFFEKPIGSRDFFWLRDLFHASAKGPSDIGYLLIALGVGFHSKGAFLRRSIALDYAKFVIALLKSKPVFVTFEKDQRKAKQRLIQFARFFGTQPSAPLPDSDNDNWGIDVILRYLKYELRMPWKFGEVIIEEETMSATNETDTDCAIPLDITGLNELVYGRAEVEETVRRLASLFTSWPSAYDACREVWRAIQNGEPMSIDVLMSKLSLAQATFLDEALRTFGDPAYLPLY